MKKTKHLRLNLYSILLAFTCVNLCVGIPYSVTRPQTVKGIYVTFSTCSAMYLFKSSLNCILIIYNTIRHVFLAPVGSFGFQ